MCKCSLRWFFNFDFMKKKVEKVFSSSIDPRTCMVAICTSLKNSGNECLKMQEASKMCQNWVIGLTWNGASIVIIVLDFMVILKRLDYLSKAVALNRINGQILVAFRDVVFASEILPTSKHCSKQYWELISSKWWSKICSLSLDNKSL